RAREVITRTTAIAFRSMLPSAFVARPPVRSHPNAAEWRSGPVDISAVSTYWRTRAWFGRVFFGTYRALKIISPHRTSDLLAIQFRQISTSSPGRVTNSALAG